jgi:hypothetical protein
MEALIRIEFKDEGVLVSALNGKSAAPGTKI